MKVSVIGFLIAIALLHVSTVESYWIHNHKAVFSDHVDDLFKKIDLNGDGKISHAEIDAFIEQLKKLDVDSAALEAGIRLSFRLADLDQDGFVSLDEYRKATDPEANFKKIDANDDGKVSFEEFEAFVKKVFPDGIPGAGPEPLRAVFDKLDNDKDGNVSLEEFKKAGKNEKSDGK